MYNMVKIPRLEIALECDEIINQIDIDCEAYILSKSNNSSKNDIEHINMIRNDYINQIKVTQTENLGASNHSVRKWCYYIKSDNLKNYPQFEFGLLLISDFMINDEQIENLNYVLSILKNKVKKGHVENVDESLNPYCDEKAVLNKTLITSLWIEQKIKICTDSNVIYINKIDSDKLKQFMMNKFELSSVQNDVFDGFKNLSSLNLSFNAIQKLEEHTFDSLTNLQDLNLSKNFIECLTKNIFRKLINLKTLNLSCNSLEDIDSDVFHGLFKLEQLALESVFRNIILKDFLFKDLNKLNLLILTKNKLHNIGKNTFIGLSNLTFLDLSCSEIRNIGRGTFSMLVNLTRLDLSRNQIKSLYKDLFIGLKSLKYLNIESNFQRYLDLSAFNGLKNLTQLMLPMVDCINGRNSSLRMLENLKEINIYDFQSIKIEGSEKLWPERIKKADLSFCRSIDTGMINDFEELNSLNLNQTTIEVGAMTVLEKFKTLRMFSCGVLNFNKINQKIHHSRTFEKMLKPMKMLDRLEIFNNDSSKFQANVFNKFSNLKTLDMESTDLVKPNRRFLRNFSNLQVLHLNYNKIYHLEPNIFSDLPHLVHLNLSFNLITELDEDSFNGLINLEHLDLKNNSIQSINGNTFKPLKSLVKLNVSNNQIKELNYEHLCWLTVLEELIASSNSITTFETDTFKNLKKLNFLYLKNNKIENIECLTNLHNLEVLVLIKNEITELEIDSFKGFSNLARVELSQNLILSLNLLAFSHLKDLKLINLSCNMISSLNEDDFYELTSIEHFLIDDNPISKIERIFLKYPLNFFELRE